LLIHNNSVKGVHSKKQTNTERVRTNSEKISTTPFVSEERTGFYFISDNNRQDFAFDSIA
jgi:hypothetical protein